MSFYTYFGKVKDELFVAVLPSGTVQPQDTIYTYTSQKFSTYTARTVTNTDDGDKFTFKDETTSFEGVSKNGYKHIHLTIKTAAGNSKAELTRQYDQPSSGKHLSNHPKIWTGSFNFHQWAKNEPFVIVAPKGLGVGRPVISNWQWTKDDKGVPNTLSTSTSVQEADGDNSGTSKFYYKQNGYYTVECLLDNAGGLKVLVKSPSNPEQAQSLLTLSAKVELSESHRLTPPKGAQEKISFDCSLPRDQPSLKRITRPLPFPSDLLETLSFSAAYVDQAGHLARYAISQFDKLNASYHEVEARLDSRAEQVTGLKKEVIELREKNHKLEAGTESLERLLKQVREDAAKREADLKRELEKTQAELRKTAGYLRAEQDLNKQLRKHIKEDLLQDIERERQHHEQELEDHKRIAELEKALATEKKTSHDLRGKIADQERIIAGLKTELDIEQKKNTEARVQIIDLTARLEAETGQRKQLQDQLAAKVKEAEETAAKLLAATIALAAEKKALAEAQEQLKQKNTQIAENAKRIADLEAQLKTAENARDSFKSLFLAAQDDANTSSTSAKNLTKLWQDADAELTKLKADLKNKGSDIKVGPIATVTEIAAGH